MTVQLCLVVLVVFVLSSAVSFQLHLLLHNVQVEANVLGLTSDGVIQNALDGGEGTPNKLLQTYIKVAPSVTFDPPSLPPVTLYAGQSFHGGAATQTLTLGNAGNDTVAYNVSIMPTGLFGSWISGGPLAGGCAHT